MNLIVKELKGGQDGDKSIAYLMPELTRRNQWKLVIARPIGNFGLWIAGIPKGTNDTGVYYRANLFKKMRIIIGGAMGLLAMFIMGTRFDISDKKQ